MRVQGESVSIELEGAQVTIPAAAIAELWLERINGGAEKQRLRELAKERTPIGALGLHGIYAGIARGPELGDDHILELLEQEPPKERMTWEEAKAWAESVGGALPTRKESALLFANVPECFDAAWYWTSEQYAGDEAYAWCQYFVDGHQLNDHKSDEYRARAVRRLTLTL
jgi:hypothetical protein